MSDQNIAAVLELGSRLSVAEFADRFRQEMIPLNNTFSWFFATRPPTEDDLKDFLEDPILALPPALLTQLPRISLLFVPFLERISRKGQRKDFVSVTQVKGDGRIQHSRLTGEDGETLVFSFQRDELGNHHDNLFRAIATIAADRWPGDLEERYTGLLRKEIQAKVHGELGDESWKRKQAAKSPRVSKEYARQSFLDTFALYLHGICCDMDVEPGPRQLPSRYIRARLDLVREFYAPPPGYAVFPEELKNLKH